MDKPTTAELRAFLEAEVRYEEGRITNTRQEYIRAHSKDRLAAFTALLDLLAEPQPAAGKVSRLDKWWAANSAHGHAWERAKAAERKGEFLLAEQYERHAVAFLSMRADYAPPVLLEGWERVETAPEQVWIEVCWGDPESSCICFWRALPEGDREWVERTVRDAAGRVFLGRTTVTHHSFLPPTHWRRR